MIVVSMTSWKKRISTLGKIIYWFYSKQTVKPDIFYLTLTTEEFPNKEKDLPEDLCEIISAFKIELNWVNKNIYAHKKYEVFKKYSDNYIFLIDDDILYPKDHIEKLIELSKKNNDKAVCCYYTKTVRYIHKKMYEVDYIKTPSLRNLLYSGLSCFPPNILNLDVFKYEKQRDKFCTKCDDSWIKAWCIKCNIPVIGYKQWYDNCLTEIAGSQKVSLWKNFNSKVINGINQKIINFTKAIKIFHIEKDILKLWNDFY